jgi:hypothetical protein
MNYHEVIESISNGLLSNFDEVYHSAEIITVDDKKFPGIVKGDEWIDLSPSDTKETIYIRRNGDDEVVEELKIGSCVKSYKIKSQLRIVYFKDHFNSDLSKLMQPVLINGVKLIRIIQDKWKLQKDESNGEYNFGPDTSYFAVDVFALWTLVPESCEDVCVRLDNPLRKQ